MKILITGNPNYGLAKELYKFYPEATFVSRSSGVDLTSENGLRQLSDMINQYDIFINCSALWKFNQTVVLDTVYKTCIKNSLNVRIICIGSTTDRVSKGTSWLYNAEKKALRDYCNSLAILGVWEKGPLVTYISFGSLSNVQHKHPTRKCLNIEVAASYIKWVIDQPSNLSINEISIDPIQ